MPIIIKDFEWCETESKVEVTVPLKGVKAGNVDIFSTDRYLKINYNPYFFELHLRHEVEDSKNRAVIDNGVISVHFVKQEHVQWGSIEHADSKDKVRRRELVAAAILFSEEKAKRISEEKAKVKAAQEKIALRQAMDNDRDERERIESVKQCVRDTVNDEINEWQSLDEDTRQSKYIASIKLNSESNSDPAGAVSPQEADTDEVEEEVCAGSENNPAGVQSNGSENMPTLEEEKQLKFNKIKHNLANPLGEKDTGKKDKTKVDDKKKEMWESGGVRQKREIEVSFSHRYFPSAARESLAEQEQEWIEKNVKASTVTKPADGDETGVEERNPLWLKDKANGFYKVCNFPSAINCYSEAIKISPELPALYVNRASCYLVLNLYDDCVQDCTKALELLTPPVESNKMSRVKSLVKRGSALCELGKLSEALKDYELAQRLQPDNEQLVKDINLLKGKIVS